MQISHTELSLCRAAADTEQTHSEPRSDSPRLTKQHNTELSQETKTVRVKEKKPKQFPYPYFSKHMLKLVMMFHGTPGDLLTKRYDIKYLSASETAETAATMFKTTSKQAGAALYLVCVFEKHCQDFNRPK